MLIHTGMAHTVLTYHYYPQNTADDEHEVPETVQFCQCVLHLPKKWDKKNSITDCVKSVHVC